MKLISQPETDISRRDYRVRKEDEGINLQSFFIKYLPEFPFDEYTIACNYSMVSRRISYFLDEGDIVTIWRKPSLIAGEMKFPSHEDASPCYIV